MALTTQQQIELIAEISYPGLRYNLFLKMGLTFLQIENVEGQCNVTNEPMAWKGRKWYISPHMTRSEIVQTAFMATLAALEHEARENFKFKGVDVLNPHLDLDHLAQVKSERK